VEWEKALEECAGGYRMVETETMNAMHTALFVREEIVECFSTERKTIMKAGFCNCFGNKGAISLVINLLGRNMQFINCHLQAHHGFSERRNKVLLDITENLV
jgi:hypothetical protein